MHPTFAKWPSIQRLSSEVCYITEKIDGTNGVIYIPEDPAMPVYAGSRTQWLTKEDGTPPHKKGDNFGFSAWVYERREALRQLGAGTHYGEFHGCGIQRNYGLSEKRFASFEYRRDDIAIEGVAVVPVLWSGEPMDCMYTEWVNKLNQYGSVMYPGFMKPEGIVITFKEMRSAKFKKLCSNDRIHKYQQAGLRPEEVK